MRVVERRSTDYAVTDDSLIFGDSGDAFQHACKGIKVEQVLTPSAFPL
jgi:hypothetical protein